MPLAMTTSTSYTHSSSAVVSTTIGFAKGGRRAALSLKVSLSNNGRRRIIGCHRQNRFFSRRRRSTHVHALRRSAEEKDKFARDTIDLSKRKLGPGTAAPVEVTFLGANGSSVTVDCPTDQYILDAALDAGLELPFTCRGGICGACVAKCVSGATDQSDITDLDFTLDEDEQKEGLTLLCMAYPVGDVAIETQSDWGMRVGEWKGATGEILGREPTKLMEDDPNRVGL